jgi:hypothetical protein
MTSNMLVLVQQNGFPHQSRNDSVVLHYVLYPTFSRLRNGIDGEKRSCFEYYTLIVSIPTHVHHISMIQAIVAISYVHLHSFYVANTM